MKNTFLFGLLWVMSGGALAGAGVHAVDEAGQEYPALSLATINPVIVGESRYAEGEQQIVEREYQLNDQGAYLYVKRKYELLEDGRLKLIWRSAASRTLDEKLCEAAGLSGPSEAMVTIISADADYPVACASDIEKEAEAAPPA